MVEQKILQQKNYITNIAIGKRYTCICCGGRSTKVWDHEDPDRNYIFSEIPNIGDCEFISDTEIFIRDNRYKYAKYDLSEKRITWSYQYKPNPCGSISECIYKEGYVVDMDPNISERNPRRKRLYCIDTRTDTIRTVPDIETAGHVGLFDYAQESHISYLNAFGCVYDIDLRTLNVRQLCDIRQQTSDIYIKALTMHDSGIMVGTQLMGSDDIRAMRIYNFRENGRMLANFSKTDVLGDRYFPFDAVINSTGKYLFVKYVNDDLHTGYGFVIVDLSTLQIIYRKNPINWLFRYKWINDILYTVEFNGKLYELWRYEF